MYEFITGLVFNDNIQIDGKCGPGRPKMALKTLKERDCHEWNLNEVDPCDKDVWRSSVRSAMPAASQLLGGEPTGVADASATMMMMIMMSCLHY